MPVGAENWKQIYDMHPSLNLIFTGSSVLDIKKGEADLSRRALMYMMQGLSFREYLQLFEGIKTRVFSLDEILNPGRDSRVGPSIACFQSVPRPWLLPICHRGRFYAKNAAGDRPDGRS